MTNPAARVEMRAAVGKYGAERSPSFLLFVRHAMSSNSQTQRSFNETGKPGRRIWQWAVVCLVGLTAFTLLAARAPERFRLIGLFAIGFGIVAGWGMGFAALKLDVSANGKTLVLTAVFIAAAEVGLTVSMWRLYVAQERKVFNRPPEIERVGSSARSDGRGALDTIACSALPGLCMLDAHPTQGVACGYRRGALPWADLFAPRWGERSEIAHSRSVDLLAARLSGASKTIRSCAYATLRGAELRWKVWSPSISPRRGWNISAQGNALGGVCGIFAGALKGRNTSLRSAIISTRLFTMQGESTTPNSKAETTDAEKPEAERPQPRMPTILPGELRKKAEQARRRELEERSRFAYYLKRRLQAVADWPLIAAAAFWVGEIIAGAAAGTWMFRRTASHPAQ